MIYRVIMLVLCCSGSVFGQNLKNISHSKAGFSKSGAKPGEQVEVVFSADIDKNWKLYSSDFRGDIGPLPTEFAFDPNNAYQLVGDIRAVKPVKAVDPTWGKAYTYFTDKAEFRQTKEELGEKLFSDPILSRGRAISCASCHIPEFAFADTAAFSIGDKGTRLTRNSPGLTNLSGRTDFFWDGRAASLEEQVLGPLSAHDEMDLPVDQAVERLKKNDFYSAAFQKVFKSEANHKSLLGAIAAFERTLETTDTPYDRYLDGDEKAMPEAAVRGRMLFIGKANCATCHSGEDFTADRFKSIGLFNGKELNDPGRFKITKDSAHIGLFKVPGLRNVAVTAPYMHNAMFKTLREVVQYYNTPDKFVSNPINRDLSLGSALNLSDNEVDDIVAFLEALTDDRFKRK